MRSPARRILVVALALLACGLLLVECLDAGASTRPRFTDRDGLAATARCVVLVLGYPAEADGTPGATERERVEWGVQVLRGLRCGRLVITGGAAHNAHVEAEVMGRYARALGVADTELALERRATSTWENLRFALPSLEGADAIYIVSEGLHARRGRRYLCRQRPELCARTRATANYRPLHRLAWKAGAVAHESWAWVRDIVQYGAPLGDPLPR